MEPFLKRCPLSNAQNTLFSPTTGLTVSRVEGDGESPYMEELELIVEDDAT